jgi:hypothetical protein
MLALAALALSGRMWSLPRFIRAPDAGRGDSASFFAFGVFSGVASSCCAPVLAGVMTLSALSGSPAGGALLGLAYVFGMVFPLLVMALAWDRLPLAGRRIGQSRPVRLHLAGWLTVIAVIAGLIIATALTAGSGSGTAQSATVRPAPGFTLASTSGTTVSLASYRGRDAVLYFSEGVGCDACFYQMTEFQDHATGSVSRAYGVLGKGMHPGLPGHGFVLIDAHGMQRW